MRRMTVKVSQRLRAANWEKRAQGIKQHELGKAAGVHPSIYSALICDITPIQPNDLRILRIAAVLGVEPSQAFEVADSSRSPKQ